MKHAPMVKCVMICSLLGLWAAVGCQPTQEPHVGGTTPQPSAAARPAESGARAVHPPATASPAPAKSEVNDADFPGPPASAMAKTTTTLSREPASGAGGSVPPAGPADQTEPPGKPASNPPITPLVDNADQLQRLHPTFPVWFDKENRQLVLMGEVCQNRVPLELFACQRASKEHESVVTIDTQAYLVHAGLVAAGADPGSPVQYQPEFKPARGPEIEVTVLWKDEHGQRHQARAQDWVRDIKTGKAMQYPWVFAGSRFSTDQETGKQQYHADWEGDLICVSNFPNAVLDIPVQSSDSNADLLFEAFTEHIPPIGTPVTLLLKPKVPAKSQSKPPALPGAKEEKAKPAT